MARPPRTDSQRSDRYNSKLIPAQVGATLTTRLPAMQPSFGSWAAHQADLIAIMQGVLSGYSVPTAQYARYYAFGFQVDKIRRRFGGSPSAIAEIANVESVWIGRGFNTIILDTIRTNILSAAASRTWDPGDLYFAKAVNQLTGHLALCGAGIADLGFLDPLSGAIAINTIGAISPDQLVWCDELSWVYWIPQTTEKVCWAMESPFSYDTKTLTTGDSPAKLAVDYDLAKYGDTLHGYLWISCQGHAKVYYEPLGFSPAPTAITMPSICGMLFVDAARNRIIVLASGTNKIYAIDRTSYAITTYTPTYTPGFAQIDLLNGYLFICEDAGNHLIKMNLATNAFTYCVLDGAATGIELDTIGLKVYTRPNSVSKCQATPYTSMVPVNINLPATIANGRIDPIARTLTFTDGTATIYKYHLDSGYFSSLFISTDICADTQLWTSHHIAFIDSLNISPSRHLIVEVFP